MTALLLLLACTKPVPAPAPGAPLSADDALSAARALRAEGLTAVAARFAVRLQTPDTSVSASGAMVVSPPDRFRIEISGPIGPPQLVLASDGTSLKAWHAGKATFYDGGDTEAALDGITGGAADLDVVTALLLGQYAEPAAGTGLTPSGPVVWPDPPVPGAPSEWRWTWCAPSGACVTEALSQATGHLSGLRARGPAEELLSAVVTPGATWPEALVVELPTLHTRAEVRFQSWAPATPSDAAFRLTAPPGATVKPLAVGTAGSPPGASSTP